MADQLDPRQIDSLTEAINNLNSTLGGKAATIQKDDIKNFDDLGKTLKGSLSDMGNFKKGVSMASKALGTMADSVGGVSRYNDAIEATGDKIATLGAVVGTLVGGPIGLLIAGFGALVYAGAKYTKAVNKQADELYKTYQDISRAGVVGAEGVQDIFKNMQKFGYGIEELGKMSELLKDNSEYLAAFGTSTSEGTKTLANMSKGISDSGLSGEFLNLGISIDQQNKGMAGYLRLQAMSGQAGLKSQQELTTAASAYILEQDKLTKLTGLSAQKQQEALERAASEERFGAKLRELRREGRDEEAKNLKQLYTMAEGIPGAQQGLADVASGYLTTKSAQDFFRTMPQATEMIQGGAKNLNATVNTMGRELKASSEQFDGLRAAVGDNVNTLKGFEISTFQSRLNKDMEARDKQVTTEQNAARKGADQATKNLVDNEKASRQSRDDLQKGINAGIAPVTGFSKSITEAGAKITGLPGKVAPGLQPERLQPGLATPGGSMDAVKKSVQEGVKEGVKQAPPIKTAPVETKAPPAAPKPGGAPGAAPGDVKSNLELIKGALMKQGITDPAMIKATLANVMKETSGQSKSEDLKGYKNTSNDRIRKIFGSRAAGKTDEELNSIKGDEKQMGEMVYGGSSKIGQSMGNTEAGDGWKYRGRGFIQLTGKNNYAAASKAIYGDDRLVKNPDLVNDPAVAAEVSAWFMKKNTGGMAKSLGMDTGNMSQEQANVLATSVIAGGDIRKKGAIGEELLGKVNTYAGQMGGVAGPAGGYQSTAVAGLNPMSTLPAAAPGTPGAPAPQETQTALFSQMLAKLDTIASATSQSATTNKKMLATQTQR